MYLLIMKYPCPKRVLIISSRDKHAAREVLNYNCIEHEDHAGLDPNTIAALKLHLLVNKCT